MRDLAKDLLIVLARFAAWVSDRLKEAAKGMVARDADQTRRRGRPSQWSDEA